MSREIACPNCGKMINPDAFICKYCGKSTATAPAQAAPVPIQTIAEPVITPASGPRNLVFAGSIAIIIAGFLPWIEVNLGAGSISLPGYKTDAVYLLIFGVLLLIEAAMVKGKHGKIYSIATGILSLVGVIFNLVLISRFSASDNGTLFSASLGMGAWLSLIGYILATAGGFSKS